MEYRPGDLLERAAYPSRPGSLRALLILNQPLQHFDTLEIIWRQATSRVCADGGANRLYDLFRDELVDRRHEFLPNAIVGDLDSLRDDVQDYYSRSGVPVSRDPDEYSTDFDKALQFIWSSWPSSPQDIEVVVLGSLSGRVDHGIGLLHQLFREKMKNPQLRLWLFSESSISFVLDKGVNTIHLANWRRHFTPNVGILPIFGEAVISTKGLEWDVKDWETKMGFQVSTSNHIVQDVITIESSEHVLFTVERQS